jgi:hypothetical protein
MNDLYKTRSGRMEAFLTRADELVVSTICAHLDLSSLRASAQTFRPLRQLAAWELQLRFVRRIGDDSYPEGDTLRALLILRIMNEATLARLTAPLLDVLLHVPLYEDSVRARLPLCAPTTISARLPLITSRTGLAQADSASP